MLSKGENKFYTSANTNTNIGRRVDTYNEYRIQEEE
jgi:hypothetical protein